MVKTVNRLAQALLRQRRWVIGILQALLILVSVVASWLLRFEFHVPRAKLLLEAAGILMGIRLAVMWRFRLMHGWWRYTGVNDAVDIMKAVAVGSSVFFLIVRLGLGWRAFPLSIYAIEALITACLLMGVRLGSRVLAQTVRDDGSSRKLVLIGAGHAAQMLIRETQQTATGWTVLCCLDDDHRKQGAKLHGVPILGPTNDLCDILKKWDADEILIAVPSASSAQLRHFVSLCEATGVPFRMLPALQEWIAGEPTLKQARAVRLEDLLGREPVQLNLEPVAAQVHGKAVMVTGAAGSIGSELCRQLLAYEPAVLVCVDHNETGVFYLEHELARIKAGETEIVACVSDIGDLEVMAKLFTMRGVETVFHAAAYKHVPLMETNVHQAVKNNVFGVFNLLSVAENAGCRTFLMISSDKAVNPTNVMGCTKRLGELILAAWPRKAMRCVSVRFGNVLGSSGSVIPVFQEQIRRKAPLTITHPEITRFFMTIPEAVSLVLQASAVGEHGDILVLDMGEPVRILDLAHSLIRLSGRTVADYQINFTGLRRGEKLYEELFYDDEQVLPTSCEKVKRTKASLMKWPELKRHLDQLYSSLSVDGAPPVKAKIKEIIPEYIDHSSPYKIPKRTEQYRTTRAGL
jgi:FlaA1/EpsC-like NDP-sugar epimerase